MEQRYFLYQYGDSANYERTKELRIIGCTNTDNLITKFRALKQGDIVILRNSLYKKLTFFGACVVKRTPRKSDKLIWDDEVRTGSQRYPWTVEVSFDDCPELSRLHEISWNDILKLNWKNQKFQPMGMQGLGKFFSGNFVQQDNRFSKEDIEKFSNLVGYRLKTESQRNTKEPATQRVDVLVSRIIRDTATATLVKLHHNNECQICGYTIQLKNGERYSEGHHLRPIGAPHHGPDIPENIICVCPNHHAIFDKGAEKIEVDKVRKHSDHQLGELFLQYHNLEICK